MNTLNGLFRSVRRSTMAFGCLVALLAGSITGCSEETQPGSEDRSSAHIQKETPNPVKLRLLADTERVKPGTPFQVGLHFEIEKPYHLYWKYPGDAGLPTRVTFEGPEGTAVTEPRYPAPIKFVQPGDIIGYGYEKDLFISAEVKVPEDFASSELELEADAKWLSCSNVCIPGKGRVKLTLPVGEITQANPEVFGSWKSREVHKADGHPSIKNLSYLPVEGASAPEAGFGVRIEWHTAPKAVEAIPADSGRAEFKAIKAVNSGSATEISGSYQLQKPSETLDKPLEILVMYETSGGEEHAITVPLASN